MFECSKTGKLILVIKIETRPMYEMLVHLCNLCVKLVHSTGKLYFFQFCSLLSREYFSNIPSSFQTPNDPKHCRWEADGSGHPECRPAAVEHGRWSGVRFSHHPSASLR